MLQTQSVNYTGGLDISTTQYNFSGKPLHQLSIQYKNGNTAQTHLILDLLTYDASLRVKRVIRNIDGASINERVDSMQYDELGQLRTKYLGNNLDSLTYDYNIRGWLTGINKNYIGGASGHYFGMELAYDKPASIIETTSYLNPVFNGNIAGTIWKTAGDGVGRKYDFSYDNVNRLTGAAYQDNKNGSWGTAAMDFTTSGLKYDANGNILSMNQKGFKVGTPAALIDQLTYSYQSNSNKLSQVIDSANDQNSKLGDFHYNPSIKTAADYSYDGNGNLSLDNNKSIDHITYNYLDLPQIVHVNGKGNITYTYDATGNKWKKVTTDSMARHSTTTLYMGDFVYQQTDTITNPGGGIDTLQYVMDSEGRARWAFHKYLNGSTAYGYEYDIFERDHLGNTRVVLTQEKDTAKYIATMEAAYRNTEDQLFYNIPTTSYARSAAAAYGYPVDTSVTNPNDSVVMLNPTTGQKVGPAIILKVMSGDKIDLAVNYFYSNIGATNGQALSPSDLINSLASGIVSLTGGLHGSFTDLTGGSSPLGAGLNSFLTTKNGNTTGKPNAYLNWVLLDNQFNYVNSNGQSGAQQVGTAGTTSGGGLQTPLGQTGISITNSGYLYIYVSNATPGWPVFFDNLSVKQYSGPMLEETHYYPFGLTMAGISDKGLKTQYAQNKYRFNGGNELQNQEFSDGSGLELYDAVHRMYDPQIGRFGQIDRLAEITHTFSPYTFVLDNPILRNDPLGDSATLPTVYVTAAKPGSLTYGLNHYNFGQLDAWVGFMMGHGHSANQINRWAVSNDLLNEDTRKWLLNSTTADSKKIRSSLDASWKAQGKLYKFFLISAITGAIGGEVVDFLFEGEEAIAVEEAASNISLKGYNELLGLAKTSGGDFEAAANATREFAEGIDAEFVGKLKDAGKVTQEGLKYYKQQLQNAIKVFTERGGKNIDVQQARLETVNKILELW